jgi:hypothetical protein
MFGGWTGIDLSTYDDDTDFRFVKMPAVQSMIDHWMETVPGTKRLKWTNSRIAEYLNLGRGSPIYMGSICIILLIRGCLRILLSLCYRNLGRGDCFGRRWNMR